MNRPVVNPDRPDTWEIQLKDGTNLLGRGDSADFKVADASVSTSHCQIIVNDGTVTLNDLGSTNGTFINGTQVKEVQLQDGRKIRLGRIEMVFHSDAPTPTEPPAAPRLRVSYMHVAETLAP